MEQKKYQDITRLGHKTTVGVLKEGDYIIIQEKLDGANASFRRDGDVIRAFSRNKELDENNNLGGFWQWTQTLDVTKLREEGIYFGEWLNTHKVKYPEYAKTFWLYDIYDIETQRYINFKLVKEVSKKLGLNLIPVFYEGAYQSFEHLQSFVGKTVLGGVLGDFETGEGIVVKNVDYVDRFGNQKFVKLVTDAFREVQSQKAPKDPKKALTQEQSFVDQVVTEARVEKFLYKFVDEGIIDEKFGIEDMGVILKNMNTRIKEDILKEESEMLPEDYDEKQLSKSISRVVAQSVKQLIINR
ncbi:RNA ligase family protein [Bacillus mycoides]|uniref:RNA ligase family protein n=1 Tax=Bacillus mycoides TaxID=1405 RepID=UPI003D069220